MCIKQKEMIGPPMENRIEVLVCNTLAKHYLAVPTQYLGLTIAMSSGTRQV